MRFPLPALFLAACLAALATVAHAAATPKDTIEQLNEGLTATLRNAKALGIEGRYRELAPLLDRTYDFDRMIAVASGSAWANANESQRQQLREAFARWSTMTYASRFSGFAGERFEVLGERPGPRDTVLVDSRITQADGKPVTLSYVLANQNGDWRIVDVLMDKSISELAVRRSEFQPVLQGGGPDKLVEVLNGKTEQLRAEGQR